MMGLLRIKDLYDEAEATNNPKVKEIFLAAVFHQATAMESMLSIINGNTRKLQAECLELLPAPTKNLSKKELSDLFEHQREIEAVNTPIQALGLFIKLAGIYSKGRAES